MAVIAGQHLGHAYGTGKSATARRNPDKRACWPNSRACHSKTVSSGLIRL
jgi:hypothetical protein